MIKVQSVSIPRGYVPKTFEYWVKKHFRCEDPDELLVFTPFQFRRQAPKLRLKKENYKFKNKLE